MPIITPVSVPSRVSVGDSDSALKLRISAHAASSGPNADDFLEHGSSGRTFDKQETIRSLQSEVPGPTDWMIRNFAVRELARDVALVTYCISVHVGDSGATKLSLRSSVWVHRGGRWQLTFHQGTLVPLHKD
ncbi:MAG: DUF4440 domain-containing protein [Acidobacteria bacterium]|nr:MAG: DUF4440 domain-containing protein [Acidobacteriota bacterium]